MTDELNAGKDMDELLRKAYADDLPADVAARMRDRIGRFRAGRLEGRAPSAAWAWFFRRTLWATLSILMLIAGIVLQGAKSSSPLAHRISAIMTADTSHEIPRR